MEDLLLRTMRDITKITLSDITSSLSVSFLTIAAGAALGEWTGVGAFVGIISMAGTALAGSIFGGIPVKVSGLSAATGALYIGIIETTSLDSDSILWAMLVASVLLFLMGLFKAAHIIRYIPNTVISGFINGVALLLMYKQLQKIIGVDFTFNAESYIALGVVVTLFTWRKITSLSFMSSWGNIISGSLIVMTLGGLIQYIFTFDVNTVSITFKTLRDLVALPNFTGLTENFLEIIVQGFLIAFIVLITTLITARALDPKASFDNEIKNQSIVNAISALLGAFPTTIGFIRTIILKRNKATSPLSGVLVGVWTLLIVFLFSGVLSYIPTTVFVGILFVAGYRALDLTIFKEIRSSHNHYFALGIFLFSTYLTFIGQLALAVIIGSLLWQACRYIPNLKLNDLAHHNHISIGE